ncbi:MAG: YihY/virulence factor BrkB family protein [Mariniblastus sp.]
MPVSKATGNIFLGPVLITSWVPNRSCYNVRLTSNASLLNQNMLKRIWQLIKMTFSIWGESNASRMAAALSYYTMLSLAPCLMMAIAIAGYIYEDSVVENEIIRQVKLISTPEIAETVKGLIQRASQPRSGIVAGTISVCVLVFAASGVFTQLYDTFNRIWGVSYQGLEGLLFTIRKRLIGVGMVLVVGIMLIGALITDSIMAYISTMVEGYPQLVTWLSLFDRSLSYLLMPLVFTLMFWFFPATKIHWKDVWPAGILTAALIAGSRYLIGFYLKFSTTSEVYGAMGSLVVILIWVYITGLMVFFGASFSHAWADTFGSRSNFLKPQTTDQSEIAP